MNVNKSDASYLDLTSPSISKIFYNYFSTHIEDMDGNNETRYKYYKTQCSYATKDTSSSSICNLECSLLVLTSSVTSTAFLELA